MGLGPSSRRAPACDNEGMNRALAVPTVLAALALNVLLARPAKADLPALHPEEYSAETPPLPAPLPDPNAREDFQTLLGLVRYYVDRTDADSLNVAYWHRYNCFLQDNDHNSLIDRATVARIGYLRACQFHEMALAEGNVGSANHQAAYATAWLDVYRAEGGRMSQLNARFLVRQATGESAPIEQACMRSSGVPFIP